MSVRPCSALCSALTVAMPPKPPPNTRMLLRALRRIPDTREVTYSSNYINTSLLMRQELHAASAPHGYSSSLYLPATICCAPRQSTGKCALFRAFGDASYAGILQYGFGDDAAEYQAVLNCYTVYPGHH